MPDNYSQWERHNAEQEAWLNKRPICCHCGHHIQEEWMYEIHGNYYHVHCIEDNFQRCVEDYIEGD